MPSTHKFSPDPQQPEYCRCGLHKTDLDHPQEQAAPPPPLSEADELKKRIEAILSNTGSWSQCKGCYKPIYWMVHNNGKKVPYTPEGLIHFVDCPVREQFKKAAG